MTYLKNYSPDRNVGNASHTSGEDRIRGSGTAYDRLFCDAEVFVTEQFLKAPEPGPGIVDLSSCQWEPVEKGLMDTVDKSL